MATPTHDARLDDGGTDCGNGGEPVGAFATHQWSVRYGQGSRRAPSPVSHAVERSRI